MADGEAGGFGTEELLWLGDGEVFDAVMDARLTIGVRFEHGLICIENKFRGPVTVGVHDELEHGFEPGVREVPEVSGALVVLRSVGFGL